MIKKLAESIREYALPSILSPIFIMAEVLLEVRIPFLTADLIDYGIDMGNMEVITSIGIKLLLISLISLSCGVLSGYFAPTAATGFAKNLRHDMYVKVQSFSFSNIDRFTPSSLITRMTTDVANLQNSYQMIIRIAVRAPFMLVFSMIMAFKVNRRLSMIFLAVLPVLALGLGLIAKTVFPIFTRAFKVYDKLNLTVQENIRGIRVVKSYVREDYEKKKFKEISQKICEDFTKAEKTLAYNSPLMSTCIYAGMLVIAWVGARLIVAGDMTTGQLMSMITYVLQSLGSLMMLSMVFVMIIFSRANAERVYEVLIEEPDMTNPDNPVMEVKDGSIVFDHVNFSYFKDENKLVLKDVNLEIKSGETVGIIGGTGDGKSTLISLIPRLYDKMSGKLLVGGVDVAEYDLTELRNQVSVVLQKNLLFEGTLRSNMLWGNPEATDDEILRALEAAQAMEFVSTLPEGLDAHVEQGGANFSGGQKQRLCIARALLKKPKILILDDSTSAVDTKTDALIRKAFRETLPGVTKLIIAQRISSVMDADKIVVIENGTIEGVGTHEELMASNKIYQEVYISQTKGGDFDE